MPTSRPAPTTASRPRPTVVNPWMGMCAWTFMAAACFRSTAPTAGSAPWVTSVRQWARSYAPGSGLLLAESGCPMGSSSSCVAGISTWTRPAEGLATHGLAPLASRPRAIHAHYPRLPSPATQGVPQVVLWIRQACPCAKRLKSSYPPHKWRTGCHRPPRSLAAQQAQISCRVHSHPHLKQAVDMMTRKRVSLSSWACSRAAWNPTEAMTRGEVTTRATTDAAPRATQR
mmetsp:Transcript_8881/g.24523  ORF Transcript_8881/g.24523 Transcript_8881/m.24523 type:complete len:229 (+) Transcript_8881:429-1115(+)